MEEFKDEEELRQHFLACLGRGTDRTGANGPTDASAYGRLRELKRLVLVHGLPGDEDGMLPSDPQHQRSERMLLRCMVWKRLLGVRESSDDHSEYTEYGRLTRCGISRFDADIRNDTFRTFRGDAKFADRVPEDKLVRLLNAFFNGMQEAEQKGKDHSLFPEFRYVQGMNVLCAPLLYAMPEFEAYDTFCQLICKHCPKYVARNLEGVETGCRLVDKCLEVLDPELFRHLSSHCVTARIHAYPLILSLFACVPPLPELLRVWDVLFAIGVHFVVILAVARTLLLRDQLLKQDKGLPKVLSSGPLQSGPLISLALQLLHRLPEELLFEIARHPVTNPDTLSSLPIAKSTLVSIKMHMAQGVMIPGQPVSGISLPTTNPTISSSISECSRIRSQQPHASKDRHPTHIDIGKHEKHATDTQGRPRWKA